ncbi:MAG: transketolase [Bacteroidetes bacterium]|jgi:transketolase|nr:transketolase [Bacteroidota bacterium]
MSTPKYTDSELTIKSLHYRKQVLQYIKKANAGHTGGSLSCLDILNVLYNDVLNVNPHTIKHPDRDRYIQSKGHSVEALYVVLAGAGFYPESELEKMGQYKSHFIGHPTKKIPGVEQNTGGLGHGLPIACGTALSAKKDGKHYKVFTLLGDGEMAEGSNWEAAMFAAHQKLDNLVAIIDRNTLQITGRTKDVVNSDNLGDKFTAFGWAFTEMDGHNISDIRNKLSQIPLEPTKPSLVIANTVKGKGVSFMEDERKWHHKVPSDEELTLAISEIDNALATIIV